jgi:hypothetical protein
MTIIVDIDWLENHKLGRSAYYQIFQLKQDGAVPITVCHWGKITPAVDNWHRPVTSGETQIHRGALAEAKRWAKLKRGYEAVDRKRIFCDDRLLVKTFGALLAHEISAAMSLNVLPSSDPDNKVLGGTAKAEPETRPVNWGIW